jgi:hypothetical protein
MADDNDNWGELIDARDALARAAERVGAALAKAERAEQAALAEEVTGPMSRTCIQELAMQLATDGETLALAVKDCARRLGPVEPGWTRFARVAVTDIPPALPADGDGPASSATG